MERKLAVNPPRQRIHFASELASSRRMGPARNSGKLTSSRRPRLDSETHASPSSTSRSRCAAVTSPLDSDSPLLATSMPRSRQADPPSRRSACREFTSPN
ncbi:hypothetical protein FH972_011953 [Carpinus fangiana]|uniref:Uncharacterized protein n=1 Tax=Carpinus fangiana TaxID=176857 RepID=A0A5N6R2C5_9ROSI|nr:hypothetical protein FH972_011953 [Carpinus fangiana]